MCVSQSVPCFSHKMLVTTDSFREALEKMDADRPEVLFHLKLPYLFYFYPLYLKLFLKAL